MHDQWILTSMTHTVQSSLDVTVILYSPNNPNHIPSTQTYHKQLVIESVVFFSAEKVGPPIGPFEGCRDTLGDAPPMGRGSGVAEIHTPT